MGLTFKTDGLAEPISLADAKKERDHRKQIVFPLAAYSTSQPESSATAPDIGHSLPRIWSLLLDSCCSCLSSISFREQIFLYSAIDFAFSDFDWTIRPVRLPDRLETFL